MVRYGRDDSGALLRDHPSLVAICRGSFSCYQRYELNWGLIGAVRITRALHVQRSQTAAIWRIPTLTTATSCQRLSRLHPNIGGLERGVTGLHEWGVEDGCGVMRGDAV